MASLSLDSINNVLAFLKRTAVIYSKFCRPDSFCHFLIFSRDVMALLMSLFFKKLLAIFHSASILFNSESCAVSPIFITLTSSGFCEAALGSAVPTSVEDISANERLFQKIKRKINKRNLIVLSCINVNPLITAYLALGPL